MQLHGVRYQLFGLERKYGHPSFVRARLKVAATRGCSICVENCGLIAGFGGGNDWRWGCSASVEGAFAAALNELNHEAGIFQGHGMYLVSGAVGLDVVGNWISRIDPCRHGQRAGNGSAFGAA